MAATKWNYNQETRKHSSRMRTTRSPSVPVALASHQMSAQVGEARALFRGDGGMYREKGWSWGPVRGGGLYRRGNSLSRGGALYGEVECIMDNGYMGHPPVDTLTNRHTRLKT